MEFFGASFAQYNLENVSQSQIIEMFQFIANLESVGQYDSEHCPTPSNIAEENDGWLGIAGKAWRLLWLLNNFDFDFDFDFDFLLLLLLLRLSP